MSRKMTANFMGSVPTTGSVYMFVAARIAERYQSRLPKVSELRSEYGMDRSTAYRWLRAIKDAKGMA